MNEESFAALSVNQLRTNYSRQAQQALGIHQSRINLLLEQGKCPDVGWEEPTIELLLQNLSLMDSNNFLGCTQLGEREGRFASDIVRKRHFRMGHGIGRSGDIQEQQPKAAGSTLMNRLTNSMVLHVLQASGAPSTKHCFVVPTATGMALVLCLLSFRSIKPKAKYVLWPRIDQKTCFKCILTAGLTPVIIEEELQGHELCTNTEEMRKTISKIGAENILCVLSTTSCFAPRKPDDIVSISEICKEFDLMHLTNNAYGVQSTKCMARLEQAHKHGHIHAYVQSTDKNFMVPVGGAIIAGFDKEFIEAIARSYPGRGSSSPTMDLFITLLTVGIKGYREICKQRKGTFYYLGEELEKLAEAHNQMVLKIASNDISIGLTLNGFEGIDDVSSIGSMLFTRFVFGTRTVNPEAVKDIEGYHFVGWGSHHSEYPHSYLTAAVGVGTTLQDVDTFISKLEHILSRTKKSTEKMVVVLGKKDKPRKFSVHRTQSSDERQ
ncbi:O-phosphoseryl-tRNA(Sec) selenium transferase [Galendromus occidentalis]|uniref:O-phosphoseryl-tRNA(Sec) selenium transferase n=1 Tax=Galendromus occidentalis TaxID=34638 RepID=A0AAJ6QS48_9ACAR|nr:O-phosphoseryl-tRNA(Sec) selenium transferase [Galendromus occidentalis]